MTAIDHDMPKHQAALRDSNMNSIAYINRAPMCCCDGFDTETLVDPVKRTKLWRWIVGAIVIVLCIAIARGVWGAERFNPGPHEIVLLLPPIEAEPDRRNQFALSDAKPDRDACEKAKKRLVVKVIGGKLVCLPAEPQR